MKTYRITNLKSEISILLETDESRFETLQKVMETIVKYFIKVGRVEDIHGTVKLLDSMLENLKLVEQCKKDIQLRREG